MSIHECPYCAKEFQDNIPDGPPSLTIDAKELARLLVANLSHFVPVEELIGWLTGIDEPNTQTLTGICRAVAKKMSEMKELPGGGTGYYSGGAFNKIQAIKAYRALTFHKETPGLKESKDFVDANEVSIESYFREIKNGTP